MSNERLAEGAAGDPSMEDILASIRRILSEDEASGAKAPASDDVLLLDPSMMVNETTKVTPTPEPVPAASAPEPAPPGPPAQDRAAESPAEASAGAAAPEGLVAPDTAESAAVSVLGLIRALAADRATPVHRTGPTIEDLVREELRPLLKAWLDAHLPALVERLVRNEIERVVNRAVP
jgi:cell pole-organizing protein PopZ